MAGLLGLEDDALGGGDEGRDTRFMHLLKPIRDLAENFSIDLATELEEYLDQLEHAQFAFPDGAAPGGTTRAVDFAEAALLIQGSTCVYSKKVEYLCTLVYQALEAVKGKKGQQGDAPTGDGAAAGGQRAGRAGVQRGDADDDDDEDGGLARFWEAEGLLKEANDIDLAADDAAAAAVAQLAPGVTRTPAALLALEDHGGGAAVSSTQPTGGGSGGGAGQHQQQGDGDAGVYRLQRCYVHASGALLLDCKDGEQYGRELQYLGPARPRQALDLRTQLQQQLQLTAAGPVGVQPHLQAGLDAAQPTPLQAQQQQQQQQHGDGTAAAAAGGADPDGPAPMDFDDDDGGGGGFGDGGDDDDERPAAGPPPGGHGEAAGGQEDPWRQGHVAVGEAAAGGRVLRSRHEQEQQQEGGEAEADVDEQPFDPLKPLDPNDRGRLPIRPLQVKKPRRNKALPVFAGQAASSRRVAAANAASASSSTAAPARGGLALTSGGLCLPEFAYALALLNLQQEERGAGRQQQGAGRRAATARQARGAAAAVFDAADAAAALEEVMGGTDGPAGGQGQQQLPQGDDQDDPWAGEGPAAGAGDASDPDDGGFGGYGGGDDDNDTDGHAGDGGWAGGEGGPDDGRPGRRGRLGFAGGDDDAHPPWLAGGGAGEMAVDGEEQSYEELCRAHIESLISAAAAREVQTDSARRVSSWRQRIGPVLHFEESRASFNIQDYGERLLGRLAGLEINDTIDEDAHQPPLEQQQAARGKGAAAAGFRQVAMGLQKFEVSRMFAAMLQLVNNRNVAIVKAAGGDAPGTSGQQQPGFRLQLLSTDLYHKAMGERLAAVPANQHKAQHAAVVTAAARGTQGADGEGDGGEDAGADENVGARGGGGGGKKQAGGVAGGGRKRARKGTGAGAQPLAEMNEAAE